jgi:hypothetical protein
MPRCEVHEGAAGRILPGFLPARSDVRDEAITHYGRYLYAIDTDAQRRLRVTLTPKPVSASDRRAGSPISRYGRRKPLPRRDLRNDLAAACDHSAAETSSYITRGGAQ